MIKVRIWNVYIDPDGFDSAGNFHGFDCIVWKYKSELKHSGFVRGSTLSIVRTLLEKRLCDKVVFVAHI